MAPERPDLTLRTVLSALGSAARAALTGRLTRYEIAEGSMVPALAPGDWVLAETRPRSIEIGDVVVFALRPGFEVVKRVASPPPGVKALWLLGDDPDAGSVDSRSFGEVARDRITAKVLLRYRPWPLRAI